ncbi:MAG: 2OG-Fe(II) oxygenase family protein [Planctomycetota bacterium]
MKVLVVDYQSDEAPQHFVESLCETGFAVLRNHPISRERVAAIYEEWLAFFDSDAKRQYAYDHRRQDGYFGPEISETAKGFREKDLKEYYHVFDWGRFPKEVSRAAQDYFRDASGVAATLLSWIELQTPDEIKAQFSMPLSDMISASPRTLLRVLRYPPLTGDEAPGAQRAAAHEDINLLTVLPASNEPGLEVRDREGGWHAVPCDFGTLVVNAGDMLQEASGGYYPSTTHRVTNPRGDERHRSRIAMPLFLHPRDEVILSAQHTALSYLEERLREMGLGN